MERRFSFTSGVVGLAVRVKEKQVVVADGNGTVSCIAVKVSMLCCYFLLSCLTVMISLNILDPLSLRTTPLATSQISNNA